MRAHIIQNGVVSNTIEVESLDFLPNLVDAALGGAIGDQWDGQAFTTPAPVVLVPKQVTRRQARQALLLAGLLSSVQPQIDLIADATERGLMQIWWDDSLDFDRSNAALITMATALGLDSAAIDALFVTAATL
jgi:hypothetical protein